MAAMIPHVTFDPAVASSQHKESLTLDKIQTLLKYLQDAAPDGTGDKKRFPISYTGIIQSEEFINSLKDKNYVPDEAHLKSFLTTYIVATRVMNYPKSSLTPVSGAPDQMYVLEKGIRDTDEKYTVKTNVRYNTNDRTLSGIQGHVDKNGKFIFDNIKKISVDDVMKAYTRFRANIQSQVPEEKVRFAQDQGVLFFKLIDGNQILFVKSSDEKGEEKVYATNHPNFSDHEEITKALLEALYVPQKSPFHSDEKTIKIWGQELAGRKVKFELTSRKADFDGKEYQVVKITGDAN